MDEVSPLLRSGIGSNAAPHNLLHRMFDRFGSQLCHPLKLIIKIGS